jgi:hypothetical protein
MLEYQELNLVYLYAKAWNTLSAAILLPHLSDDVLYTSQNVMDKLRGIDEVGEFIEKKIETIRSHPFAKPFAEIGFCGTQDKETIKVTSAYENRPCVVLAQGNKEYVGGLVLLDTEDQKIKEISICTVAPHPSTASRTGIYPGREAIS